MKQNGRYLAITFATAGLLLSGVCAARKTDSHITVSPNPYVIVPDSANKAHLDFTLRVPAGYVPKRGRIMITPQLMVGDSVVTTLDQQVLYSPIYTKKMLRRMALDKYVDPYALSAKHLKSTSRATDIEISDLISLPDDVESARLVAVVSADGCGVCTGIETIDIALISSPITIIEPKREMHLSWIEPEFRIRPKVREGKGVANLQFGLNKSDINLGLGNNEKELGEMIATLEPILSDSLATLTSLDILGMASADGSFALNSTLSRNRAQAAKNWLVEKLGIAPRVQKVIKVGSRPEVWQPVLDAMIADGHPDTQKVKEILEKYAGQNDDVAERYIRRLPCWNDIKAKYLHKDRKVEYVYTYTIRSFTDDAELLDMYKKRPDAFNEDELLRVASLMPDDESRKEVYLTLMHYFPQSAVAANNLAVLYLREGNQDEARSVLEKQKEHTPEQINTLAATYIYDGSYQKAIELLEEVELPEARYNLGLIKAKQRKLGEAYDLLLPYADVNAAIAALSIGRNDEAASIMARIADGKPMTQYVKALVAARTGNDAEVLELLEEACADDRLRRRAAGEPDFTRYSDSDRFKSIVGE